MAYYNVCWNCRHEINSDTDKKCEMCGWYICPRCGSCQQGSCVNLISDNIYEIRYLRHKIATERPDRNSFIVWGKELIKEKRSNDKEKAHKEAESTKIRVEKCKREEEAMWQKIEIGVKVIHNNVNKGCIAEKKIVDKFRMFTVYFPEDDKYMTFVFPDSITNNHIKFAE